MTDTQNHWDATDKALLELVVRLFDERGIFLTDGLHKRPDCALDKDALKAALLRLRAERFIGGRIAGGRVFEVSSIGSEARRLVSGYPSPRVEASVPQLENLGVQLGDVLAEAAALVQAEPNHPEASRWRKVARAALDVGIDFGSKTTAEVIKGMIGVPSGGVGG
jgi:hypothetical protein